MRAFQTFLLPRLSYKNLLLWDLFHCQLWRLALGFKVSACLLMKKPFSFFCKSSKLVRVPRQCILFEHSLRLKLPMGWARDQASRLKSAHDTPTTSGTSGPCLSVYYASSIKQPPVSPALISPLQYSEGKPMLWLWGDAQKVHLAWMRLGCLWANSSQALSSVFSTPFVPPKQSPPHLLEPSESYAASGCPLTLLPIVSNCRSFYTPHHWKLQITFPESQLDGRRKII